MSEFCYRFFNRSRYKIFFTWNIVVQHYRLLSTVLQIFDYITVNPNQFEIKVSKIL